jgi:metal-responsive CopG/Arc/MetJ family transcriptional regulator
VARSAEKVAVSVDRNLLRTAERLRARTGESRSAFVSRALRILVRAEEHDARVKEYVEAYRRVPETAAEQKLARSLAKRSLRNVAWRDR